MWMSVALACRLPGARITDTSVAAPAVPQQELILCLSICNLLATVNVYKKRQVLSSLPDAWRSPCLICEALVAVAVLRGHYESSGLVSALRRADRDPATLL